MKRLTTVNENMKRIQKENNLSEAVKLLKDSIEEIKEVENSISKRNYPDHCFPSVFSDSQELYKNFKRRCKRYCIKNAREFLKQFYEIRYPDAKQYIKNLTQIELKT